MTISQIMEKMIAFSEGNIHDIDHFIRVWTYAHTFNEIAGMDWQILVEADYIANATENDYSEQNIRNSMQRIMKTETGKRILQSLFGDSAEAMAAS